MATPNYRYVIVDDRDGEDQPRKLSLSVIPFMTETQSTIVCDDPADAAETLLDMIGHGDTAMPKEINMAKSILGK